jgi:NADH pyrophosphatase NudC (nudix superfamily)
MGKKYIDADALKEKMFNYYDCVNLDTGKGNYKGETLMNYEVADMIEDCIDNTPTADVQEVKHGKWLADRFGMERAICSVCRAVYEGGDSFRFCPKCGTKMDLEEKNE